jgi:hypothetical protein
MPEGRKGRRTGIRILRAGNGSLQRANGLSRQIREPAPLRRRSAAPLYTGFS